MLIHKLRLKTAAAGFTLVEMVIVMAVIGILVTMAYTFFNTSFNQYISLQAQGTSFTDLATQSQRLATVLRGTTDIISASADDIDCYAYFAPSDTFVSEIHYYKTADDKQLLADVTRMTANPPQGTTIPDTLHTYTIINNFFQVSGVNTFTYLDATGTALPFPVTDLNAIKGVQVVLTAPGSNLSKNTHQTVSLQVSLRNRKTNL